MRAYRFGTAVLALVFVGIGVALLVETAIAGGAFGFILGGLFITAGTARLYLLRSQKRVRPPGV
jgi:hypothetical protein